MTVHVFKSSPLENGHVAQGSGKGMHEAPHVLHERVEESPCGEGRKEKGRYHVGSLCGFLCVPCRHLKLKFYLLYIVFTRLQKKNSLEK